jgi:predicted nucleic acid-binding protein
VNAGCVVDASVALKWVLAEEGSDAAAALLDGRPLFAPALLKIEIANCLWKIARRGALTHAEAADALDVIQRAPLSSGLRDSTLAPRALQLAQILDHPAYDCLYLALAVEVEAPVITADGRFFKAAQNVLETAPFVRMLAG